MSKFSVDILAIDQLEAHPNADKLELVIVGGYKSIVGKGDHKIGDTVIYIPCDAVIPSHVALALGIEKYLAGANKDRVKAVRLRGSLSEGIVIKDTTLQKYMCSKEYLAELRERLKTLSATSDNLELHDALGITKYIEPIPMSMSGKLRQKPACFLHYDIENLKQAEFANLFQPNEEVIVTEKRHGACMSVTWEDNEVIVSSHGRSLLEDEHNVFWKAARKYDLIGKVERLHTCYPNAKSIMLFGEALGVQDLKYGFTMSDPGFEAFDLFLDGVPLDYEHFANRMAVYRIPIVPYLFRNTWGSFDPLVLAEQDSVSGGIREGIVVRSAVERYDLVAGRCQLKLLSGRYLTRTNSDATEMK